MFLGSNQTSFLPPMAENLESRKLDISFLVTLLFVFEMSYHLVMLVERFLAF